MRKLELLEALTDDGKQQFTLRTLIDFALTKNSTKTYEPKSTFDRRK